MAIKKNEVEIIIPRINLQMLTLKVIGDTPLIMHKWSEKAKKEILDKQTKAASVGRKIKNPVEDFIESMYWLSDKPSEYTEKAFNDAIKSGDAKFGFPSVGFKAAAVSAGYRGGVTKNKVSVQGAFHIMGDMVEIKSSPPVMREDMVRVQSGGADIRYRGQFDNWSAEITIQYNANVHSAEQIINLFNLGGFACGVGEWRPEKGGSFGMFRVAENA